MYKKEFRIAVLTKYDCSQQQIYWENEWLTVKKFKYFSVFRIFKVKVLMPFRITRSVTYKRSVLYKTMKFQLSMTSLWN